MRIGPPRLVRAIRFSIDHSSSQHLLCFVPSPDPHRYSEIEDRIRRELSDLSGVDILGAEDLESMYPVHDYHDPLSDEVGRIPFKPIYFAALGTAIMRKLHSIYGPRPKVIVVDCDGTLWNGVCGEDGPDRVSIDAGRRSFQEFLLMQHAAGVLLCLCSKNSADDVAAVFELHPEMSLRREHFVAERVNWKSKSENVHELASELNLGLDSFIFLDDNPVECAELATGCPSMTILNLPPQSEAVQEFLSRVWVFDHKRVTPEDTARSVFYRQEGQRKREMVSAGTFGEFLRGLELQVVVSVPGATDFHRASESTFRTNQFNATGARLSEAEIAFRGARSNDFGCLCVRVSDRFGDYGLAGLLTCQSEDRRFVVDGWWLSCRALGRGVEERIIGHLAALAKEKGADELALHFRETGKNRPVLEFFNRIGCEPKADGLGGRLIFALPVSAALNCMQDAETRWAREPQMAKSAEADDRQPSSEGFGGARWNEIATELHDAGQILGALDLYNRKERGPSEPNDAPLDEIESALAKIWSELLRVDRVSREDNFFELGGDSILAVRLLSEIRRRLGCDLEPNIFFSGTLTVADLAKAIESNSAPAERLRTNRPPSGRLDQQALSR